MASKGLQESGLARTTAAYAGIRTAPGAGVAKGTQISRRSRRPRLGEAKLQGLGNPFFETRSWSEPQQEPSSERNRVLGIRLDRAIVAGSSRIEVPHFQSKGYRNPQHTDEGLSIDARAELKRIGICPFFEDGRPARLRFEKTGIPSPE